MKRHPALIELSREHHGALSLARRIALAEVGTTEWNALRTRVLGPFRSELMAHFADEETRLLPLLGDTQPAAVERLLDEHRALKRLLDALKSGEVDAMKKFGTLLSAHVRFEERQFFVLVQEQLPTAS
ncbi:hemerythrin domain-containing protein [Niveibacterium sp. SC-1]|uniref:hemerythrin domain-containing protein n=1 Tax=Niveibacterium sp. SC-1 TaxID=3135646 RepID=UPI00311E858C